jgi:tetratricopeptide (TPR) repeat protein
MPGLSTATRHHTRRDVLAMYPSLRVDHLRYLEKCGVLKPVIVDRDSCFGFSDLTVLRQVAGDLQKGAPFRAVARTLQSTQRGQLTFDFGLQPDRARVIELTPRSAPVRGAQPIGPAEQYFLMGSLLEDGPAERIEEAIQAYRRALDHNPDLVPALINLAAIRYSRHELPEAIALYERAIVLDHSSFEAHLNLGNINLDLGRYSEAETSFRRALAVHSDDPDAHFYLAITLERMGRSIDARAHWKLSERLSPEVESLDSPEEQQD